MQIPILNGIKADEGPDWRTSYPRNMMPVPRQQGISAGYLRPAEGIAHVGTGPGACRGGINWNGKCYRVMGNMLVRIDASGEVDELGSIPGSGPVTFAYSFDRLAIAADGALYYSNGDAPERVSDPDLGTVRSVAWIDGYFMITDGSSLVVTDLADPASVNPLRYGSSEADPDPIMCMVKGRAGEIHAVNRYTIELFNNVGGSGFPFARNEGGQIGKGAMGSHCAVSFLDQIAFLGGGRGEPPAIWIGINGSAQKLSSGEIDTLLLDYTGQQLAASVMESRATKNHQLLYLHLPDQTLVYDASASAALQEPVWFSVDSGLAERAQYRARDFVWCYDRWLCGDPASGKLGEMVDTVSTHYDDPIGWEFGTSIVYNEGRGAIFHQLELVALPGRVPLGADPVIWTSYSIDGENWSQERAARAGRQGERGKRIIWLGQGSMRHWRVQRFRGTSDAHIAFARLEVQPEALNA